MDCDKNRNESEELSRLSPRALRLLAKDWLLPPAIYRCLDNYSLRALSFYFAHQSVFRANRKLQNRHRGERCFILCNGPSVKEQDISLLFGETVLSVSSGYRHLKYLQIRPKYHFVPQVTYASLPVEKTVDWFQEMHRSIGEAELFLSWQEWPLVNERELFLGRTVSYLCMGKQQFPSRGKLVDLDGIVPGAQSVPVMALMAAMYMGFDQLYLIGVDHDWFVKKEYKFFYDDKFVFADSTVGSDGTSLSTMKDDIPIISKLWGQYWALDLMAKANGIQIFNATHGGMLDIFPRVRLEDVLK